MAVEAGENHADVVSPRRSCLLVADAVARMSFAVVSRCQTLSGRRVHWSDVEKQPAAHPCSRVAWNTHRGGAEIRGHEDIPWTG